MMLTYAMYNFLIVEIEYISVMIFNKLYTASTIFLWYSKNSVELFLTC